jgi:hypothetical protein
VSELGSAFCACSSDKSFVCANAALGPQTKLTNTSREGARKADEPLIRDIAMVFITAIEPRFILNLRGWAELSELEIQRELNLARTGSSGGLPESGYWSQT